MKPKSVIVRHTYAQDFGVQSTPTADSGLRAIAHQCAELDYSAKTAKARSKVTSNIRGVYADAAWRTTPLVVPLIEGGGPRLSYGSQ